MLLDFFRNSTLSLLFAFTCIICFTILLSGLQIDHLKCHPNAKLNCKIIQNNSMLYATVNSIVYQKGKFILLWMTKNCCIVSVLRLSEVVFS